MSHATRDQEILERTQTMLDSVIRGDWQAYASFCSPDLSCFEAETEGVLAEGLSFHRFYFPHEGPRGHADNPTSDKPSSTSPLPQVTMARPHLRWLSDEAVVVSYTRLTQSWTNGVPQTSRCCETRIWQRQGDSWLQVHVHRS